MALVLDEGGKCQAIAKVATEESSRLALLREANALVRFGPMLPPPLSAPRILGQSEGVLVLEPVSWRPRLLPWQLPASVAYALGVFHQAAGRVPAGAVGLTHGDCAPWNLLWTSSGWVLVDWEEARDDGPPFFDVFSYLVQAHALIGCPSRRKILEGLRGQGWAGAALSAYAEGAGLCLDQAMGTFSSYLHESWKRLNPLRKDDRKASQAISALLAALAV